MEWEARAKILLCYYTNCNHVVRIPGQKSQPSPEKILQALSSNEIILVPNKSKLNPYDLVMISWVDSQGIAMGWEHINEIESMPAVHCKSVGFVWESGDDFITLVPTMAKTQIFGRLTIPRVAICGGIELLTVRKDE